MKMLSVSLLTSYTRNVEYPLRTSPPWRWWPRPSSPPRVHRRGTCTGRWRSGPRPPGEASSSRTCPGPRTHTAEVSATSRWPGSCCPCSWSCFSQTPCIVIVIIIASLRHPALLFLGTVCDTQLSFERLSWVHKETIVGWADFRQEV